jgi:MFS family permease
MGSVGFETLVARRIALGAGEGPATPVALHSAYKWFPDELRTLPTAVIVQGGAMGVMVALPLLNWVICVLDLALGLRLTRPGRPHLVRIVARLRPRRVVGQRERKGK